FDVFGDHQLDAGTKLGVRGLLAAGALAPSLPAHCRNESTSLDVATLDGNFIAAFQAGIRKFAQSLIEEKADMGRRNLVGGDVVPQLGILPRIPGVPGKVFSGQLASNQLRILRQKEDAARKFDLVRSFLDFAV